VFLKIELCWHATPGLRGVNYVKKVGVDLICPAVAGSLELIRGSDLFVYLSANGKAQLADKKFAGYLRQIVFWLLGGLAVSISEQA